MKKIPSFLIVALLFLLVIPKFSFALDQYYDIFEPGDITWELNRHEVWADIHTYEIQGEMTRDRTHEVTGAFGYEHELLYVHYYKIFVSGIYKPKELSFEEEIYIKLVRGESPVRGMMRPSPVPFDRDWTITVSGVAGYDPWLWPDRAKVRNVTGQFNTEFGSDSPDDKYGQFTFPLPLSFDALTETERTNIKREESGAILSPCENVGMPPRIKSPESGEILEWKRLNMSFEVDCRFNSYSSNVFEVELQWYEPGLVEQGDNTTLRSEGGNFRPYPDKPELVLDMQPAANQYEDKSWGSGHLDLTLEGRYRLRVRSLYTTKRGNTVYPASSVWSPWRHFVSGSLKPDWEESALAALPDLVVRRFKSNVYEAWEPWPDGTVMNARYFYYEWRIRNVGAASSPATELHVECDSRNSIPCFEGFASSLPVDSLDPGTFKKVSYLSQAPAGSVEYRFRVIVDPGGEITETSEENNYFYSVFSSGGPVISAGARDWLGRDPSEGGGQEETSGTAKGAFGAKVLEKSGKETEPPPGMKQPSALSKRPSSLRDSAPIGETALSRDRRMKALNLGSCVLGFRPLSVNPRAPKDSEPFDLLIPFENTGGEDCLPSQEYNLLCHVQSGPGPCPFTGGSRKLGKRVRSGETTSLAISGATARRGKYTVKVSPNEGDLGNIEVIYLTVGPVVDPASVDKSLTKKQGIDPDKMPDTMQKMETEEGGVKVPSSGSKLQSR